MVRNVIGGFVVAVACCLGSGCQDKALQNDIDELRQEALSYQETSQAEAELVAGQLTAPYYAQIKDDHKGELLRDKQHSALFRQYLVIETVASRFPELKHASMEKKHAYLRDETPAYLVRDLAGANNNLKDLIPAIRSGQIKTPEDLTKVRQLFKEYKQAMAEALSKARAYREREKK